jgi:hypothetical protein
MKVSDRQPTEVREIAEIEVQADLRRAAHKIAWARMNGSIEAANPFGEANPSRVASGGLRGTPASKRAQ